MEKEEKKCPLHRKSEGLSFGKGVGYCDIGSGSTTCQGHVKLCDKPDALKRYLHTKLEETEGREKK